MTGDISGTKRIQMAWRLRDAVIMELHALADRRGFLISQDTAIATADKILRRTGVTAGELDELVAHAAAE